MSKSRLEWKVGLFVLIGLVLLAVLLIEFSKGMSMFKPTYEIKLHSSNVGGLKPRATVLMSGVQVGSVSELKLAADGKSVTITLRIDSSYVIHKDARFVIEQSGFLGDQYVGIVPTANEADRFRPGDSAQAEPPFNLQEFTRSASGLVQRVDDTLVKLDGALSDVIRLVLNKETLTNLSLAVGSVREVAQNANTVVDSLKVIILTNGPGLNETVSNLTAFSVQLQQLAGDLKGVVAANTNQVNEAVSNVLVSTESLKSVMKDLQAGKGLAGNLLQNEQLVTNVSQITQNLSVTTSNLNQLGLWGVLWRHKTPHTNAPPARPLDAPKFSDN
jgi:phospholipid/cholesterol/gamma-HCH transport system substrate-binding protein